MADFKPKKDNTFCWYPFYHLALKVWTQGEWRSHAPCCNSIRPENDDPLHVHDNIQGQSLNDLFHSPEMKKLRDDMLNGRRNPACNTCWVLEDQGQDSYRFHSVLRNAEPKEVKLESPELKSLDISLGEDCNMRCRMCTPANSNKLRTDNKYFFENDLHDVISYLPGWEESDLGPSDVTQFDDSNPHFKDLLEILPQIRQIFATGGETLISKGFHALVDAATETGAAPNIMLNYHTNASVYSPAMLEKLKKFRKSEPVFSVDATGLAYEYIRHPVKWKNTEKSIKLYLDNIETDAVHFTSVISIFSLGDVINYINWTEDLAKKYEAKVTVHFDNIWPMGRPIDIEWLPEEMLVSHLEELKKLRKREFYPKYYSRYENVIGRIEAALTKRKESPVNLLAKQSHMLKEVSIFDQSRNQSYKDYLPADLVAFLDSVKVKTQSRTNSQPSTPAS